MSSAGRHFRVPPQETGEAVPLEPTRVSPREASAHAESGSLRPGSTQAFQGGAQAPAPQPLPTRPAVPSPSREGYDYYEHDARKESRPYAQPPRRSFGRGLAAGLLGLLAVLARLAAVCLSLLVVASAVVSSGAYRQVLMRALDLATSLLPRSLAGLYVFQTPLGGAFRGDLVIAALALFVIDWILARLARRLRG